MGKIAAVLGVMAFLVLALPRYSPAFWCGSGLVNIGDKTGKVLIECGPPTSKEAARVKTKGKSTKAKRVKRKGKDIGAKDLPGVFPEGGKVVLQLRRA
jgi:hypothetical protein